jgi:hypothetical protein
MIARGIGYVVAAKQNDDGPEKRNIPPSNESSLWLIFVRPLKMLFRARLLKSNLPNQIDHRDR